MNDYAIEVKDFRKTYGDFIAVDGISFDVQQGEVFGLLGDPTARERPPLWRAWRACAPPMVGPCG